MEQAQSLLLNELAFARCPDPQKNIFIYEWLKYLDRILLLTKKVNFLIKSDYFLNLMFLVRFKKLSTKTC
jgi:hypothetical protein